MAGTGECCSEADVQDASQLDHARALWVEAARARYEVMELKEALQQSRRERQIAQKLLQDAEKKDHLAVAEAARAEELALRIKETQRQLAETNRQLAEVKRKTIEAQRCEPAEVTQMRETVEQMKQEICTLESERSSLATEVEELERTHRDLRRSLKCK